MLVPCLVRASLDDGQVPRLRHPLVDNYLQFVGARARPNTVLATAFDLKVFFTVITKDPVDVDTADVLEFIGIQCEPRRGAVVVRIEDGEKGCLLGRSNGVWPRSQGCTSTSWTDETS